MDRRAGLVRRQSGNDRRLVRRVYQRAGRCLGAATSGNDHPLEFHRRQVHRRLSLPRRGPTLLLRHWRIRQLHGRHERHAALSRVQRRPLGRALGTAPGAEQSISAHVARESDGWGILAARQHSGPLPRDQGLGAAHRRLARRLLQRPAQDGAAHDRAEQGAHRPLEPLRPGLRNTRSVAWRASISPCVGATTGSRG